MACSNLTALIGIVLFTAIGAVKETAAQSSTLTAFYTAPVVSMAPMWIAKEAGFFKKQGLDVRLVFIASGPLGTTSILSGDVDVGVIGGFAPIRAIAGGAKNLVMIGQTKNRMTGAIVGKKEIATVADLKGKRLGIDRVGSNPDMFTQAALARFNMDPLKDVSYIQLGSIGQGIPALKAGTIDAVTTSAPHDLFAQRLGFKVILDITALKIPFASTVLLSSRNTVARKQADLTKFMRAYAEAMHYFLTNAEGTNQIVAKYTKVEDREVNAYAIDSESQAVERTLQVDPKGIELILGLIGKSMPQAASAKPQDFYDPRFFTELEGQRLSQTIVGRQTMRRRNRGRKIVTFCTIRFGAVLIILLTAPTLARAADKLIGIHSSRVLSQSLPWIAREAGLFKKYNLDFDLVFIASSPSVTAAMLSGEAEVALGGGEGPVRAYLQGATDFVFIGGFKNVLTHSILARPEIARPADLKGKKVGINRVGSNPHYFAVQALRRSGVDPADVNFMQSGGSPETLAALLSGSLDAASLNPPADAQAIARGMHYVVFGPELRLPYAATVFLTRRSILAKRQAVIGQFLRTMAEAGKIVHTDKEFVYKVMGKYLRLTDRKVLDAAYNGEVKVLEKNLELNNEGLQSILDEVSRTDPRAKKIRAEDLVDRRFLEEMKSSGFFDKLWKS